MIGTGQAFPGLAVHHTARVVERIHHLRALLVGTGDQHEFTAQVNQAARAAGQIGSGRGIRLRLDALLVLIILIGQVFRQAPRLDAVGGEHCGLRQQQVDQCAHQLLVGERIAAPGTEHRVEHQGNIGVVGNHFGNGGDGFDTADHADLDRRHRHVLQHAARLVGDPLGLHRQEVIHAHGVLHGDGGNHGEGMATQAGQSEDIGLKAGTAGRVGAGKNQHDGWGRGGQSGGHAWRDRIGGAECDFIT